MSYLSEALTACPDIQNRLNALWQENGVSTGVIDEPMVQLEWIVNNTGQVRQLVHPGQNKKRQVELIYEQYILESSVTESDRSNSCTATTKRGDCSEVYTIDPNDGLKVEQLIEESDLRENCEDNAAYINRQILKMINAMDRKVATKTAEDSASLLGAWGSKVQNVNGSGQLEVETLRSGTTDELAPFAMEDIDLAKRLSLFNQNTLIVGGQTLYKYARRVMSGCCTDSGIDIGDQMRQFNFAVAHDFRVADAAGSEDVSWAIQAGALQLLQWTNARWKDGVIGGLQTGTNYTSIVVQSPMTGVAYDLWMKDDCGGINLNLYSTTKVVAAPDDMFPTGGIYDQINFFAPILVNNT